MDTIRVSQASPAAAASMPGATSNLGPMRGSSTMLARLALTMIAPTMGRKATPAITGMKPRGLLQVVGEEQEDAEHAGAGDEDADLGGADL